MAASSSGFPERRVERVLEREGLCGPEDRVVAEGPFLQLSDDGVPERQVFLGVTSMAFIVVKQEIPSSAEPDKLTEDLEVSDLVLSQELPLPLVKVFTVDDTAKRFTVCTSCGHLLHFEMCQLDANFETAWTKWRQTLIDINVKNGCLSGYNHCAAASVASNQHGHEDFNQLPIAYGSSDGSPLYVHRPMAFIKVRSFGTQTMQNDLETDAAQESHIITDTFLPDPIFDSDDSDGSVSSRTSLSVGARMSDRLDIFSIQSATWDQSADDDHVVPDRCVSWIDCADISEEKTTPEAAMVDLKLLRKKQKQPMPISYRRPEFESDDDSDEDVGEVIGDILSTHTKGHSRSGSDLWRTARHRFLSKGSESGDRFGQIVFMYTVEQVNTPPYSILFLKPTDISSELTSMFARLLINLRIADIEHYSSTRGRQIPTRLAMLLKFGENVSKMVATEILRGTTVLERVLVIKHFVEVCVDLLFKTRDFLSLIPVLRGLTSLPIYRLDDTWATLFVEQQLTYRKFLNIRKIISPVRKYAAYYRRVKVLQSRGTAFLPWLEHFLWHCQTKTRDSDLTSGKQTDSIVRKQPTFSTTARIISFMKKKKTPKSNDPWNKTYAHEQENEDIQILDMTTPLRPILTRKNKWSFCPLFEKSSKKVRFTLDHTYIDDADDDHAAPKSIQSNENTNILVTMALEGMKKNKIPDSGEASCWIEQRPTPVIDAYCERVSKIVMTDVMEQLATIYSEESDSDSGHGTESIDDEEIPERKIIYRRKPFKDPSDMLFQKMLENSSIPIKMNVQQKKIDGSTRPAIKSPGAQNRRKSWYEEVTKTNDDEKEDNDSFERLKISKLNSMKKRGSIALALLEPDEDLSTSTDVSPKQFDRSIKSRMKASGDQKRRMSWFQEITESNDDEKKDDDTFEKLKKNKLNSMKKRGSIALDLLTPDGYTDTSTGTSPMFEFQRNISNNSRQNKIRYDSSNSQTSTTVVSSGVAMKGSSSDLTPVSKSISTEYLQFNSMNECHFCANEICLYSSDTRKDFIHFQNSTESKIKNVHLWFISWVIQGYSERGKEDNFTNKDLTDLDFAVSQKVVDLENMLEWKGIVTRRAGVHAGETLVKEISVKKSDTNIRDRATTT